MKSKIKSYFRSHGFYDYRRGWDKGTCLYCGSEDKAGVNVGKDFYHCFVCEEKNKLINVIMEIEEISSFSKCVSFLKQLPDSEFVRNTEVSKRIEPPVSVLPEGYINIRRGDTRIADKARDYVVNKRHIPLDIAAKWGLGYVPNVESKYFGRIIIPFKKGGKVVYFQARAFLEYEIKFKNPETEEVGAGKSQVIYNEEALDKFEEVSIVESVFNALTIQPEVIGLNGKVASAWQLSKLQSSEKVKAYNIILDNDAWEYAKKLSLRLIKYRPLRLVRLGPLDDSRDINNLGREVSMSRIKDTPLVFSEKDLRNYINKQDESFNKPRRVRVLI